MTDQSDHKSALSQMSLKMRKFNRRNKVCLIVTQTIGHNLLMQISFPHMPSPTDSVVSISSRVSSFSCQGNEGILFQRISVRNLDKMNPLLSGNLLVSCLWAMYIWYLGLALSPASSMKRSVGKCHMAVITMFWVSNGSWYCVRPQW